MQSNLEMSAFPDEVNFWILKNFSYTLQTKILSSSCKNHSEQESKLKRQISIF
jgi:hypothetical protein